MVPGVETEQMFASSCELIETDTADTGLWRRVPTCSVPILLQVAGNINGGGSAEGQSGLSWEPHPDSVTLGLSVLI